VDVQLGTRSLSSERATPRTVHETKYSAKSPEIAGVSNEQNKSLFYFFVYFGYFDIKIQGIDI